MNRLLQLLRRAESETGIAMVTAVLVTAIVATLTIGSLALATHNTTMSAYDRDRTQAIHAANAGIDQMVAYFKTATGPQVCGASTGPASTGSLTNASGSQLAQFVVKTTVTRGTCPNSPTQVQINSYGYATSQTGVVRSTREMESLVNVKTRVFSHAMFHGSSTQTLVLGNKTDGNLFLDADVYSNADVSASNNITISGDLITQGKVTMSGSSIVKGTVWAKKSITMSNSAFIATNAVASQKISPDCGCITMSNNTRIGGNARAAGTITPVEIDGTQTPNSPSSPPPVENLPTFTWNPTDPWPSPVTDFTACAAFNTWFSQNQSHLVGTQHITATDSCPGGLLSLGAINPPNNSVMQLTGDLAIINYGDINFSQQTTWLSADGQVHNLWLISTNGNVNFGNNTNFDTNLHVFVYTPFTATLANQNTWYGQVYANVINSTNQFTLEYVNAFPPGFTSATNTGYAVDTVYVREVVPS